MRRHEDTAGRVEAIKVVFKSQGELFRGGRTGSETRRRYCIVVRRFGTRMNPTARAFTLPQPAMKKNPC
jgi:hypothetical protein